MKDKLITLIIGILIGAIITTAGFLIYNKFFVETQSGEMGMEQNGDMGEAPDGDMGEAPDGMGGGDGEEPPEMPDGENGEAPESNSNSSDETT